MFGGDCALRKALKQSVVSMRNVNIGVDLP